MSNAGKFKDPIPNVQTAGKTTTIKDESAQLCVQ